MRNNCSQVILENFFEPCVLCLLYDKPSYGYELNRKLLEQNSCRVNVGNLYRGLNRLLKQGYILRKKTKSAMGPARNVYSITPKGKKLLASWIKELEEQQQAISMLITSYRNHL